MHTAKEAGIHFVAAGHYATERIGIRSLGEHLTAKFGLEAQFIDIPNPV
jgi:putative NIF3 family GTP cyclohydrolase 1 type 2